MVVTLHTQHQGHSKMRAFKIIPANSPDALPTLFYKTSPLDQEWKGFHGDHGFRLMTAIPEGFPPILPPQALSDDALKDLKHFYPHMDPQHQSQWDSFLDNQFSDRQFDEDISDPWLEEYFTSQQPESVAEEMMRTEPIEEHVISVPTHPPIVATQQLIVGDLYLYRNDRNLISLGTFHRTHIGLRRQSSSPEEVEFLTWESNEDNTMWQTQNIVIAPVSDILVANITLTKIKKIRVKDLKMAQTVLDNTNK